MRFAGTCTRYSNSAMPQLASAAITHGFDAMFLRWAYHANVMKTFEITRSPALWAQVGRFMVVVAAARVLHAVRRRPARASRCGLRGRARPTDARARSPS